jgi:aspartyl-tRNA(Asn)/glutamyl-tRNA(Gln) amidotransferase subunit B
VSARVRGAKALGTKTEVKNMNSISGVQQALAIEFERQCGALERGDRVEQQTMLWDAAKSEVRPARSKEGSHDYRYFPEPDLLPLVIPPDLLEAARSQMRELPRAKRARFKADYGIDDSPPSPGDAGRGASDAEVLTATRERAHYFEAVVQAQKHGDPKSAANWMITELLAWANAAGKRVSDARVTPAMLAQLTDLVHEGTLSHTAAKKVFALLAASGGDARALAEREGLIQERDAGALATWVDEVLAENPAEAARYLGGEAKLQGVLVGLVMKKSKGRADPKQVNQLLASRVSRGGG